MAKLNPDLQTFANILVIGVGGSGNNAVSRMIASKIEGVSVHIYGKTETRPERKMGHITVT